MAGTVTCTPAPEERRDSVDFFANPSTSILFRKQHEKLVIRMQARVQLEQQPLAADFSPDLSRFPAEIANVWSLDANSPHHFLGASPRLPEDSRDLGLCPWHRQARHDHPPDRHRHLR